jgi:hypothetical protein
MNNLVTISGATLWVAVVFALMLTALTPVSVATPTDVPPAMEGKAI